jgi:hypothetical protein
MTIKKIRIHCIKWPFSVIRRLFTFSFLLLFVTVLHAQVQSNEHFLKITNEKLTADNGELISLDISIQNPLKTILSGKIRVTVEEGLELVSRNEVGVEIKSGESRFSSFKILVPKKTKAIDSLRLHFELLDLSGIHLEEKTVYLNINTTKNIVLYVLQKSVQMRQNETVLKIPVRIQNRGNTDQTISLIAKFPSKAENNSYIADAYQIKAFLDTIIDIQKPINKQMLALGTFDINITCLYEDGDIAGMGSVYIQSLRNKKSFNDNDQLGYVESNALGHEFDMSGQFLFTPYETYQIRGGSNIHFDKNNSNLAYSVDAQFYKQPNIEPYIRNTFLTYEKNNNNLTIGNIMRNYDLNLYGRGISVSIDDTARKKFFEVGWMDESYNLLGKSNYAYYENGKAIWGNINLKKKEWWLKSVVINETNPVYDEKNFIQTNELDFQINKHLLVKTIIDGAYTGTITNSETAISGAGGLNLEGDWGKLRFNSENFITSPYYPGIKRGSKIFNDRLTFSGDKVTYWIWYSNYKYDPEYLSNKSFGSSNFSTSKVELGISGILTDKINYSISPNYYSELSSYPTALTSSLVTDIKSIGSGFRVTYLNNEKKVFFYLNGDPGIYESKLLDAGQTTFHFKINSALKLGAFNLSVFGQLGEFYSGEVLSRYYQKTGYTKTLNITPYFQKKFFENKLDLQAGLTYTFSNISSKGIQITGRAELNINAKDRIYASVMNSQYDYYNYSLTDFRLGIIKSVPQTFVRSGRKNLTVFIYKDVNNNQQYDSQDSIAQEYLVYVNKESFISEKNGKIYYKKVPIGEYSILVPSYKGWHANETPLKLTENTTLEIPLHRSCIVRGNIIYAEHTLTTFEVAKIRELITIQATSKSGKVYYTKSDETGHFVFYIPPGDYDFEITAMDLPDKVACSNSRQAMTINLEKVNTLVFNFAIKEQEIKLQKFVSPSVIKQ